MVESLIEEQYEVIDNMSEKSGASAIRDALNKQRYVPKGNPDIRFDTFCNPGVDMYSEEHKWTENGWDNIGDVNILSRCPEYLPSKGLIRYLSDVGSILEIASGDGYWSYIINQNGGDCLATDILPRDLSYEDIPDDVIDGQSGSNFPDIRDETREDRRYPYDVSEASDDFLVWSEVAVANHTCIPQSDSQYVLICHPEQFVWVQDALDLIVEEDKTLILVSEWGPSMDATLGTYLRLDRKWNMKEKFNVIDWKGMDVGAYVMKPPNSKTSWRDLVPE